MHTLSQMTAKMPYVRVKQGNNFQYTKCHVQHCEKDKHPDVGIALCEAHLQKAWAAYQILLGAEYEPVKPRELQERDVLSSEAQGYVYFARVGNLIKIGWTHHLERRMLSLQADALLFSMPGDRVKERSIHTLFKPYLDHGREWFEYHPDILRYIDALRDARKLRSA